MNLYSEKRLQEIITKFEKDVPDELIVDLVNTLACSGRKLKFCGQVFDFASTGGPSSLTTILVPLYLYGFGKNVINLAVPGRPAGAVDVLAQIPGYNLETIGMNYRSNKPFYYHLEANEEFVPFDNALFTYRKKVNKVDISNLVIASLLSKKIASGATHIGLDVRISPFGNFGKTWKECQANAIRYNRIAEVLGLKSTCFLSDASYPYQRYIGRGEALEAVYSLINCDGDKTLIEHDSYCKDIARCLVNKDKKQCDIPKICLKDVFSENLEQQGSSFSNFEAAVEKKRLQTKSILYANQSGYLYYDLEHIREFVVFFQNTASSGERYPDPCGITLLQNTGDYVYRDTPIISIRGISDVSSLNCNSLFSISEEAALICRKREVI